MHLVHQLIRTLLVLLIPNDPRQREIALFLYVAAIAQLSGELRLNQTFDLECDFVRDHFRRYFFH